MGIRTPSDGGYNGKLFRFVNDCVGVYTASVMKRVYIILDREMGVYYVRKYKYGVATLVGCSVSTVWRRGDMLWSWGRFDVHLSVIPDCENIN